MTSEEVLFARKVAALEAIKYLKSAEVVGVGTGSTVSQFIAIAHDAGVLKDKTLITSSYDTSLKLAALGYRVTHLLSVDKIDVYVDSADEVDEGGRMIKGGGGALLMEKVLASYSDMRVYIVDWLKLVKKLGEKHKIPVEVIPSAVNLVVNELRKLGYNVAIRESTGKKGPVISDSRGVLIDVEPPKGISLEDVNDQLIRLPGVVETGLFLTEYDVVIVGFPDGSLRKIMKDLECFSH